MSDKTYPAPFARRVADKIVDALKPVCSRLMVVGDLRRQKPEVSEVQLLYIPKNTQIPDPHDFFGDKQVTVNAAEIVIKELVSRGSLATRSDHRLCVWSPEIKNAVAVKTSVPVDLFAADERTWWHLLAFYTGPIDLVSRIAHAAMDREYTWNPSRYGFERRDAAHPDQLRVPRIHSERAVFEFCGLPYKEPQDR